ncbi:MAG: T9SS type A sorting domain-containing protein [Prevotellaceae bacterium]|jgi:hypothetical protein|nr:T9SS type A sorting domain-containing protein [Prevotellaceae bacterium]
MKKNSCLIFFFATTAAAVVAQPSKVVELTLNRPDVLDVWVTGVPKYERDSSNFVVLKGTPPYLFEWEQTRADAEKTFYDVTVLDGRGCSYEISTYVSKASTPVEENALPPEARAYPNPVADVLNIPLNGAEGEKVTIRLFDVGGRLLLEKTAVLETTAGGGASSYPLSLADYPAGKYFVLVATASTKTAHSIVKK